MYEWAFESDCVCVGERMRAWESTCERPRVYLCIRTSVASAMSAVGVGASSSREDGLAGRHHVRLNATVKRGTSCRKNVHHLL